MSKCRVRTVIRYTHSALTTIHRSEEPEDRALGALESVWPRGIPYASQATSTPATRPGQTCQVRLQADAAEQDQDDHEGQGGHEGGHAQ